jgi:hypothetical protein
VNQGGGEEAAWKEATGIVDRFLKMRVQLP